MLCPNCGKSVGDIARFCIDCQKLFPKQEEQPIDFQNQAKAETELEEGFLSFGQAGFWLRFFAFLMDGFFIYSVTILLVLLLTLFFFGTVFIASSSVKILSVAMIKGISISGVILYCVLLFLIVIGTRITYYSYFESSKLCATPGKLLFGLVVCTDSYSELSFLTAFFRNIAKILSYLILGIGFLMIGFSKNNQGLHDLIVGTYVVKKEVVPLPRLIFLAAIAIGLNCLIYTLMKVMK